MKWIQPAIHSTRHRPRRWCPRWNRSGTSPLRRTSPAPLTRTCASGLGTPFKCSRQSPGHKRCHTPSPNTTAAGLLAGARTLRVADRRDLVQNWHPEKRPGISLRQHWSSGGSSGRAWPDGSKSTSWTRTLSAIGGRFESWTHPDPALVDDVAERLTGSIPRAADARESTVQPDDLQRWLEVRDQVP